MWGKALGHHGCQQVGYYYIGRVMLLCNSESCNTNSILLLIDGWGKSFASIKKNLIVVAPMKFHLLSSCVTAGFWSSITACTPTTDTKYRQRGGRHTPRATMRYTPNIFALLAFFEKPVGALLALSGCAEAFVWYSYISSLSAQSSVYDVLPFFWTT